MSGSVQALDPSLPGSMGSRHGSHFLVPGLLTSTGHLFRSSEILHNDGLNVLLWWEHIKVSDVMVTHRNGEVVEDGRHNHSLHLLAMMETEVCANWEATFPDSNLCFLSRQYDHQTARH